MAEQQQPKAKKGAKKAFFEVRAPMTSSKIHLYATSMEELEGKIVKLDLTRSLKGKNFELNLKVKKTPEGLEGEPVSLELVGSYIRRMMRTGIDYVEESFVVELKDGKARIKPFMITRNKVSRSIRSELRNTSKKFLQEYFRARTLKEGFSEIMTNKVQKELFVKLKKVYPLALCEIRIFELV
jgi:ribosomal protein S3AE